MSCLVLLQAPNTICSFKWSNMAHSQQFITSTAGFPNQSSDTTLVMHKLTGRSLPNTNKTVSAVNCCQKLLLIQTGLCFGLTRYKSNWAQVHYALLISSLKLKEFLGVPFETEENAVLTSAAHQGAVTGNPLYGKHMSLATFKVHPQYLGRSTRSQIHLTLFEPADAASSGNKSQKFVTWLAL